MIRKAHDLFEQYISRLPSLTVQLAIITPYMMFTFSNLFESYHGFFWIDNKQVYYCCVILLSRQVIFHYIQQGHISICVDRLCSSLNPCQMVSIKGFDFRYLSSLENRERTRPEMRLSKEILLSIPVLASTNNGIFILFSSQLFSLY